MLGDGSAECLIKKKSCRYGLRHYTGIDLGLPYVKCETIQYVIEEKLPKLEFVKKNNFGQFFLRNVSLISLQIYFGGCNIRNHNFFFFLI